MSRTKQKRKTKRGGSLLLSLFLVIILLLGAIFFVWARRPENLRPQKNWVRGLLFNAGLKNTYNAKSLLVLDLTDDEILLSKAETSPELPASLAKLFVIDYANTLAPPDSLVQVPLEALALVKPGSSRAWIQTAPYRLQDLYAAMLVPSGNDAAYAVADYLGGLLDPNAAPGADRVHVFLGHLRTYLRSHGCPHTELSDPSGYDLDARTTAADLVTATHRLLQQPWFREIVGSYSYTAHRPDGGEQTWTNTNLFLDPSSAYYNPAVKGVKTGSLGEAYNLLVLYSRAGKEYLICSLGSSSDEARYEDVRSILQSLDGQ